MARQPIPTEVIVKKLEVAGQITNRRMALAQNTQYIDSGAAMMDYFAQVYERISRVVEETDFSGSAQE